MKPREKGEASARATGQLIAAMLIFGTIGLLRRYLTLPSAWIVMARGILGSVFLTGILLIRGQKPLPGADRKTWLMTVISGAFMGINWLLLFEAYRLTTVATATLCYYMEPTFLVLLSPLLFRERITLKKGLCALISVAGMVLVSGVGGTAAQTGASTVPGILCGLGAAVFYTAVVILNKKTQTDDIYGRTMIQLASAAAVLLPYILLSGQSEAAVWDGRSVLILLVMGIVHTGVAYILYFGSLPKVPAQRVAVISYLDPVSALILGAAFLREPMTGAGWLGAALIIGAAAVGQ